MFLCWNAWARRDRGGTGHDLQGSWINCMTGMWFFIYMQGMKTGNIMPGMRFPAYMPGMRLSVYMLGMRFTVYMPGMWFPGYMPGMWFPVCMPGMWISLARACKLANTCRACNLRITYRANVWHEMEYSSCPTATQHILIPSTQTSNFIFSLYESTSDTCCFTSTRGFPLLTIYSYTTK